MRQDRRMMLEVHKYNLVNPKFEMVKMVFSDMVEMFQRMDNIERTYAEKYGMHADVLRCDAYNIDGAKDFSGIRLANDKYAVDIIAVPYAIRHARHYIFDKTALELDEKQQQSIRTAMQRNIVCINCLEKALARMEDNEAVRIGKEIVRKSDYRNQCYHFAQCQKYMPNRQCIRTIAHQMISERKEAQYAEA